MIRPLLIICLFIFYTISVANENKSSLSLFSYQQARKVLLSGIDALGGIDRLNSVQDFDVSYKEYNSSIGQNVNPQAKDFFNEGGQARYIYNAQNGFSRFERNLQRQGRLFNPVLVYKGNEGFFYWPETGDLHTSINVSLMKGLFTFRSTFADRLIPHLILQSALKQLSSLRSLGTTVFNNLAHDVITFSYEDGTTQTLFFDQQTHFLAKTEELLDDLLSGDAAAEVIYSRYRDVNGLQFPDEIILKIAGNEIQKIETLSVELNSQPGEQLFQVPQGAQPADYPRLFIPQRITEDVYFVPLFNASGISYNSMFVVFDDYVMVFDAPLSDLLSQFYIALIKKVAPGKAIKFIVPTHHHSDHIGGIKRFVAEGATVVTTTANKNLFEQIIAAPRTLRPSAVGLHAKFDIIAEKKSYEDAHHKVQLFNVGPNAHADEIFIAYLPKADIMYVTDLFWGSLSGHHPTARSTLIQFAAKIKDLGLKPQTIIPGHGKVSSINDFNEALMSKAYQ